MTLSFWYDEFKLIILAAYFWYDEFESGKFIL